MNAHVLTTIEAQKGGHYRIIKDEEGVTMIVCDVRGFKVKIDDGTIVTLELPRAARSVLELQRNVVRAQFVSGGPADEDKFRIMGRVLPISEFADLRITLKIGESLDDAGFGTD
jgi:hypothetical protein